LLSAAKEVARDLLSHEMTYEFPIVLHDSYESPLSRSPGEVRVVDDLMPLALERGRAIIHAVPRR